MLRFFIGHLEAFGVGIVVGVMAFLLINVAVGRPILASGRTFEPIAAPEVEADPDKLYQSNCGACHQGSGEGLPGQFPPLVGSSWVLEDPETPVRVVLAGIQGPIDVQGTTYNGVMPAQGHLSDEQIAKIVTYIRQSWGNEGSEVDPALVATLRAELSGRGPWQGGEELQAAQSE